MPGFKKWLCNAARQRYEKNFEIYKKFLQQALLTPIISTQSVR